ncbi:Pyruvate carboxylase subunit B [Syntrophaceticus schinkii]|jgi:oxaloacetate decarboxylase alpha subunit|uniref:Pyruvate carboxylase subunit B n=2 Tax=Syntrophaceticus schinkii TaxID=499207 RepID=A0A0B7MPF2_9FIRM|nr:Pyruvate carboxylase subunit B [Syntrophaceticus schinkii]
MLVMEDVLLMRPKITDTTLRDAHQSLWATRMYTEDMVPILERIDQVGYFSLEMWGGATFDVCIRYLNEDPWDRIRTIKKYVKRTPLQMLLRGQNLVGYANYPDDLAEVFVYKAAETGIDIFRVFDALNDVRNLEVPMRAVKKTGKHLQACVVYTLSPVHTKEHYLETALCLQDMGADSICIKDMAGMISPYVSYELVSLFKERLDVPVQLHTHYIGGMAIGSCLKGVEAGLDVFDACSGPLAFGSSQPPVETLVRSLQGTEWDTGLDIPLLFEISNYWEDLRRKRGYERGVTRITDMKVFDHQVPGGMITNLVSQLEEQNALHRIGEVLNEIPKVREELGYPPLVTPTSQIVGIQAVLNVLTGSRYKMVPQEVKDYVRGSYGRSPAPIDPEVQRLIIGDEEPITCRPADLLENKFEKTKEEIKELAESEEDYITYALFPPIARRFFEYREKVRSGEIPLATTTAAAPEVESKSGEQARKQKTVKRSSRSSAEDGKMDIEDVKELIKILDESNLNEIQVETTEMKVAIRKDISAGGCAPGGESSPFQEAGAIVEEVEHPENLIEMVAPMVGTFYRAPAPDAPPFVEAGCRVKKGDTLCIIEAMKLMNEIEAECDGEIVEILVENAQPVEYGQALFIIAPVE